MYLILSFGFLLLQGKYAFGVLSVHSDKKKNNQPTNQTILLALPLTMNYVSLFSMSHPLACWEHSSHRSSEIKTVKMRLEDEVRRRNPHRYSAQLVFIMVKWC